MHTLALISIVLGAQKKPTELELRHKASSAIKAVFLTDVPESSFKVKKGPPLSLKTTEFVVYISGKDPQRIAGLIHHTPRMKNGPPQGKKFKTLDEWERHGMATIHKIWPDVDGYLSSQTETGDQSFTVENRTGWISDSNPKSLIWFTHPVKGKVRMVSGTFELGTGKPLNLSCSAPMPEKKHPVLLDNSKKRLAK